MPSQTVHIPTEAYRYILKTEDGSISGRAAELIEKGVEAEQEGML